LLALFDMFWEWPFWHVCNTLQGDWHCVIFHFNSWLIFSDNVDRLVRRYNRAHQSVKKFESESKIWKHL